MGILYNGSNPFVGQPIPFVKISNDYTLDGSQRIDRTTLTLRGELLACSQTELFSLKEALELAFKTRAEIEIDGLGDFEVENVQSISFDDSPLFARLPYSISLQIKDNNQVLDKVVEVEFIENIDQTLSIKRTISARGKEINGTTDQAWIHAKNFVQTESAKTLPKPFSIDSKAYNYFLISSEQDFDRINKNLSLTQTFKSDLYRNDGPILRHTKTVDNVLGEETSLSIGGTVECGRQNGAAAGSAPAMRQYSLFKQSLTNSQGLPVRNIKNENVSIDEFAGRITFSFQYTDSLEDANNDGYILTFNISAEESGDSSLIRLGISGTLKMVDSFTQAKRTDLINQFNTRVVNRNYLYDKVLKVYNLFYTPPSGIVLNTKPLSNNYSVSKNGTSISFSASFDDRYQLEDFESFNYTLKTVPAIKVISIQPSLSGGYHFYDLGMFRKAQKEISVSNKSCSEDISLNQIDWANFKISQHIAQDVGENTKQSEVSKSYSANNVGEYSCSLAKIYNGAEFAL